MTRVLANDWSGAVDRPERKIWLAEAVDGRLKRLEDGRNREEIAEHLIAEARRDPELVVGLDFAFSLPVWYLERRGLSSAPELWALAEREAEEWLRCAAPPFWGRTGTKRPVLPADLRVTELAAPATGGHRPKSVFQVNGGGAVGTGSLRGMRLLSRLADAGFRIWPFAPVAYPLVIEIYPRLLTGPVRKTDAAARRAYLAAHAPHLDAALRDKAIGSDDAFDAAVSALAMAASLDDLTTLPTLTDETLVREGVIWAPGWAGWHITAAKTTLVTTLEPDRRDGRRIDRTEDGMQPMETTETLATIERFNAAFNRHDVDAVMALMTDDVVFVNTSPPPDGERYEGQTEVRAFWERFFADSPHAWFDAEDVFAAGDRCLVRWRYRWGGDGPNAGHIRGVDVFRVRDSKVAEKLAYVKG